MCFCFKWSTEFQSNAITSVYVKFSILKTHHKSNLKGDIKKGNLNIIRFKEQNKSWINLKVAFIFRYMYDLKMQYFPHYILHWYSVWQHKQSLWVFLIHTFYVCFRCVSNFILPLHKCLSFVCAFLFLFYSFCMTNQISNKINYFTFSNLTTKMNYQWKNS